MRYGLFIIFYKGSIRNILFITKAQNLKQNKFAISCSCDCAGVFIYFQNVQLGSAPITVKTRMINMIRTAITCAIRFPRGNQLPSSPLLALGRV